MVRTAKSAPYLGNVGVIATTFSMGTLVFVMRNLSTYAAIAQDIIFGAISLSVIRVVLLCDEVAKIGYQQGAGRIGIINPDRDPVVWGLKGVPD